LASNPAHNSSNVSVRIADADFPLIYVSNVTFASGGHLQFSYLLVAEAMEGFWRSLLAAAAVASGQGDKVGADAPLYDQPRMRAFVDSLVHSEVEPMLKQVVLENRRVIPGMDLG
jgi:hypothetical protein